MLARRLLTLRASFTRSLCTGRPEEVDPSEDKEFVRKVVGSVGKNDEMSDDFLFHNAAVVSAYSSFSKSDGAKIGVFWKPEDEHNIMKTSGSDSFASASLEALIAVLRQAIYERHIDKLVVNINSDYVTKIISTYLKTWKDNDFKKANGDPVKNRELIEEIDHLIGKLNVRVKNCSSVKSRDVKEALESQFEETFPGNISPKTESPNLEPFNPHSFASFGPLIYAASAIHENDNGFIRCGYAIKWADETCQMLDETRRLSMVPATEFRAQLSAIELALKKATEQGLPNVVIVTDSVMFFRFHSKGWRKANGEFVANLPLYKKICKYLEKVNTKFVLLPVKGESGSDVQQVRLMAEDGLGYPTL